MRIQCLEMCPSQGEALKLTLHMALAGIKLPLLPQFQIFCYIKFPGALGQFFSSLRISASYAVVGAVISEWLGGFSGLGVYMTRVKKAYSFDKMFAVIFLISAISLVLMWGVELLQKKCMPWERRESAGKK